jgi:photosystem II stability/assembly factor-like uncharacterized protein
VSSTRRRRLPILLSALVLRCLWPPAVHGAASPAVTWVNVTGNLAGMASQCGNLTMVSPEPGSATIIAGVALDGLWASNGGSTWSPLGSGAGSDPITNRPSWITYDPVNPGVFWESGIYNGGGVYRTSDNGSTFHQLGSISHIDYVSVDFGDPSRQTLLAGGHEESQTVYRSTDGGQTWTNIGVNLPAGTGFSSSPLIINSQTYVVNADTSWGGGSPGIYRTTNGGTSWLQVSAQGPAGPPLVAANGAIYWPVNNSLVKSTDSGSTWTQVGSGISVGAFQPIHPIELSDGRLVSAGATNLMVSADGGSTWSPIGDTLPYTPVSLIYSPNRGAFFISHFDCGNVVLPDAVMSLDDDLSVPPAAPAGLRIAQ